MQMTTPIPETSAGVTNDGFEQLVFIHSPPRDVMSFQRDIIFEAPLQLPQKPPTLSTHCTVTSGAEKLISFCAKSGHHESYLCGNRTQTGD
jgi:hypothetical protein